MSQPSRLSTTSVSTQPRLGPDDLHHHTLRVAYLTHITSPRLVPVNQHEDNSLGSGSAQPLSSSSTLLRSNQPHRPHLRQQAEGWTNTIFSIADVFKDSPSSKDGRSVKFPKELIKVLKVKIEAIARGSDKNYQDMLLRSTFGVFYGTYTQDYYLKQLKENRNIEALILLFVTTATGVLKKRLEGDEWKTHLNSQVGVFVTIVRDCLRSKDVKGVPHELSARLDSYASKLAPQSASTSSTTIQDPSSSTPYQESRRPLNLPSASSSSLAATSSQPDASSSSPWAISHSVQDMAPVKVVGALFRVSDSQLQKDINTIKKFCTEQAFMDDLKLCISNIAQQCRFPGRRTDFDSDEAYNSWRTKELAQLQQDMLEIIKSKPELVHTRSQSSSKNNPNPSHPIHDDFVIVGGKEGVGTSSPSLGHGRSTSGGGSHLGGDSQRNSFPARDSFSSVANSVGEGSVQENLKRILSWENEKEGLDNPDGKGYDDEDDDESTQNFKFIPPNPHSYYIALMDHCLDFDLESMKNLAEDEEVSLKILSHGHLELLEQCAYRWRLTIPFQVSVFFEGICRRFEEEEIPIIECVSEALNDVFRVLNEIPLSYWTIREKAMIQKTMSSLFDTLLRRVYEAIQAVISSKPTEELPNLLETLISVYESEPFKLITDLEQRFSEFSEAVTELFDRLYSDKSQESLMRNQSNEIVGFLQVISWIGSGCSRLNKRFKQPVLGRIDLVSMFLYRLCRLLVQDLNMITDRLHQTKSSSTNVAGSDNPGSSGFNEADVLELYSSLMDLQKKHDQCNSEFPLDIPFDGLFLPYINSWLDSADCKTSEWVHSAIKADKFVPEGNECHSTSIIDLMDSCRSAVDFIQKLSWPNEYYNAKFLTRLSQTISKSIEIYCRTMEEAFVEEMFPKASTDADREANRSAIWTRARMAVQGDKKPEAFQFQEASCIKLNNIEAARTLLDKMYNTIDADNVARIIHEYEPEQSQRALLSNSSFLFTVKVVHAEGLVGLDGSVNKMDPFLTLSDEKGNRVAKTRTLYETTSPNWNETFDISVKGSLWLAATIYKRNLVEKHEFVGRAFLHLNPKGFNDFLAHDLLIDLDTTGRVLLRVSMEGEKDDVQFYFGKAFRSLKRAETDMVRMIVDKISPVIRYYISHANIRKLLPSSSFMKSIDVSKIPTRIDIDISKVTSYGAGLWRSVANSGKEPEIPLPKEELMMLKNSTSQLSTNQGLGGSTNNLESLSSIRNKGVKELTDSDIENAIADLFEYFDECMSVLRHSLSEKAGKLVMGKIWKEILLIVDGVLLPPLSDQPSDMKPLSGKEVDIVLKWLKFLTNFFHANGEGVSIEDLHNQKYKEIWSIGFFYDQHTDTLMEECVRAMQQQFRRGVGGEMIKNGGVSRNKSVYQQRNLGTIRKRKAEKKNDQEPTSTETIMRILRLRPGTSDFLQQQMSTLVSVNAQKKKP
ncbi:hypothetical protein BY996DRAFT_4579115 [Phakopsora pachyrhizi]|nr:hypothetical protein BY996DRAFT_4579115 [Phakopsora pachyrhizi]